MPAASTKSSWRRQATEEQSHNAAAAKTSLAWLGRFCRRRSHGSAAGVRRSNCRAWWRTRFARGADCRRARTLSPALSAVPRGASPPEPPRRRGSPRFLPAPRAATSVRSRSAVGAPRRTAAPERGPAGAGSSFAADNVIGHCVVPPRSCAAAPHAFPVARTARGRAAANVDPAWGAPWPGVRAQ